MYERLPFLKGMYLTYNQYYMLTTSFWVLLAFLIFALVDLALLVALRVVNNRIGTADLMFLEAGSHHVVRQS